jgi:hypothetical protein
MVGCPRNEDDAIMLHLYHKLHVEIERATMGTDIAPAYLAAIVSLESHPPGNRSSERFEPYVYQRLVDLKNDNRAFGKIKRESLVFMSDAEIRQLATSYGLTQVMGFHCLELGCSIQDLKGPYHLQWAVGYMMRHYGPHARKRDWNACFRIHNTGLPDGTPARKDYVDQGLMRMQYYQRWMDTRGDVLTFN